MDCANAHVFYLNCSGSGSLSPLIEISFYLEMVLGLETFIFFCVKSAENTCLRTRLCNVIICRSISKNGCMFGG